MLTTASLSAALLLILGLSGAFGKPVAPAGGDGAGLHVRLKVPWPTLIVGEEMQYEYVLDNASGQGVVVAAPDDGTGEKAHFGWPAGGQPFIEPKYDRGESGDQYTPLERALNVGKAMWPPRDGFGKEMGGWLELSAGQRIVWNQNRLPACYFGVASVTTLKGIQAHWLVGPDRWISSAVVPLKVVSVPMSDWRKVFEDRWSSYGYGKDVCSATAHVIPIDGKTFLFMGSFRVTEVNPDETFKHQIDKDCTNMEIIITGPSGTRKVYYHLRHGLTRDTPWPIGPVSLFYPNPEPIPPAELEALRKEMAETGAKNGTRRDVVQPSPQASAGGAHTPTSRNNGAALWFWIVGGVVCLVVIVISLTLWAKHGKSSAGP